MKKRIIALTFFLCCLLGINCLAEETKYETLSVGSTGDAVVKLQEALIEKEFLTGTADGQYGNGTAEAVISFQESTGISSTGVADSITQEILYGEYVGTPGTEEEMSSSKTSPDEDDLYKQMYEKYKTLIDALEEGKYKDAHDFIDTLVPKVETGVTKLTTDNWTDFFTTEYEYQYDYDAYGAISRIEVYLKFKLRSEYEMKDVNVHGTVGYIYKMIPCDIGSVDLEKGTIDYKPIDGWTVSSFGLDKEISESGDLEDAKWGKSVGRAGYLAKSETELRGEYYPESMDCNSYYLMLPSDFQVVRMEGTITVH